MTRSESKRAMLDELGAEPVVADALDPDQVAEAVGMAKPDVIVHQLTALTGVDMRHLERNFALTNRLRTGGPVKSEEDGFDPTPAREMRANLAAIRHLEEAVVGARWTEGIVLRYGAFYGPGTSMAPGAESFEMVRKRKFPVVGDGGGVWSFIHVAAAAEATVAALTRGSRGAYNVVDDDPATVAEWPPALAQTLGARKPMRVPRFIGRLFAGEAGVVMMTELRGASNAKAKRELEWHPAHPSWRFGSVSEAEDVVQEALLRVHQALDRGEQLGSPRAFAATVTTRLAINELHSARSSRALRRGVAAGADHHRRSRRPGPACRDSRLAVAGDAGAVGESHARAASRAVAARCVRLRISGDRSDRRPQRGQRSPARHPCQTPRRAAPATAP